MNTFLQSLGILFLLLNGAYFFDIPFTIPTFCVMLTIDFIILIVLSLKNTDNSLAHVNTVQVEYLDNSIPQIAVLRIDCYRKIGSTYITNLPDDIYDEIIDELSGINILITKVVFINK